MRPSAGEVRAQLDAILASEYFATSRRASGFLQHVVDRSLAEDNSSLKERLIGIEVFQRRSDFDTTSDSIVRVTANDVRKRLLQYDHHRPEGTLRILLPLGSYVPDIIGEPLRSAAPDAPDETPAILPPPPATAQEAETFGTDCVFPREQTQAPADRTERRSLLRLPALHWKPLIGTVLAVSVGWFASTLLHPSGRRTDTPDLRFYNDLLGRIGEPGTQTQIALSNPRVVLYRGSLSANPFKEDEVANLTLPTSLNEQLKATANDTQGDFPYHYLQVDDKNYTGLGEAEAAFGLASILQATGRSSRLTQARFLNWDVARDQQLVILGAPHMSSFAQSSLDGSNFIMDHDAIRNLRPQAGEKASYARNISGSGLEDYGLIWMGKSQAASSVLVLAGLTSTGTAGVGQFFADPARMRPVYEQLRANSKTSSFPEAWQVLIRIDAREDVPVKATVLAVRVLDSH